jgi:hypothetical protein
MRLYGEPLLFWMRQTSSLKHVKIHQVMEVTAMLWLLVCDYRLSAIRTNFKLTICIVFLRHLEYFSGIVFLTSNRVTIFDMAMKSRIHLAIEYSPPELQMRRMIWAQCLKALLAAEIDIDWDETIDKLSTNDVNGREIANAVNTAKTLACFDNSPLRSHHIETGIQVRRDFDRSIAKKSKAIEAAESREGSIIISNRKNSILVSSSEASKWLP